MKIITGVNDMATTNPELLREWNYTKNNKLGIYPNKVTKGSQKKVFWLCSAGHEWETTINNRTLKGSKCPYCAGQKALTGINDLATTNPELLAEWNYERNSALGLEPTAVSKGSNKKAWWKCSKGHEWQTRIIHKANGKGCPVCTNRTKSSAKTGINDLATVRPELLAEWNYEKNSVLGITPFNITYQSSKKVWWKCSKGHEWQAIPQHRTKGTGCPVCYKINYTLYGKSKSNTIANEMPNLLDEWDYEKNNALYLDPTKLTVGSSKTVNWKCSKGHTWQTQIRCRAKGTGCPYCAGTKAITGETDLTTTNPELLKEWNYEKNNDLGVFPDKIKAGSRLKVWWKCAKGHEWQAKLSDRNSGASCPKCSLINRKKNKCQS